jgi:excisionase family DNA binding protein
MQGKDVHPMEGGSTRLLRIEDVADRLAVSRAMVFKLVAQGDLPSVRIGRAVRIRPGAVEEYIAQATRDT